MKKSIKYKIAAMGWFMFSSFTVFAQSKTSVELDTLQKIFGFVMAGGGLFMAYMTMRLANKMAEQELKYNAKLDNLEEKLTLQFDSRIKDVENKMATHHDINNLKQFMVLQHENVKDAQNDIKERLKDAKNALAEATKRKENG